jgi:ABC-type uncharacterized transport system substrate-binding protein
MPLQLPDFPAKPQCGGNQWAVVDEDQLATLVAFEFRSAEGQIDRLPELAAELVRLKVDVIVTWFTPTAVAARQATREIPIVMAETGDPIGTGLVMSLKLGAAASGGAPHGWRRILQYT